MFKGSLRYNRLTLAVAGLGGLLFGIDVGVIAGALPYLADTSGFGPAQLSFVVAAVLLGSVVAVLFAGALADWIGRKYLMALSGCMFVASLPIIALSHSYGTLVFGRLLQGTSAGFIGVVVPLYLAECLRAKERGKGTGVFQWMLTFGFVVAGLITLYFSYRLGIVSRSGDATAIFAFKDHAWRNTFWVSLPAGVAFVIGSLMVAESPRWLYAKGRRDAALAALQRSRTGDEAALELREMDEAAAAERVHTAAGTDVRESLLHRKYVIPFVLACVILTCNQLTGINSIIPYNTTILLQAGLSDVQAHAGSLVFSLVNFLVTMLAVFLVDRRGRKFLLSIGSAGIILSLIGTGALFAHSQARRVDVRAAVQAMVSPAQSLHIRFDPQAARRLLERSDGGAVAGAQSLSIIYSYGDFSATTNVVRTDDAMLPVKITRSLPANRVAAFFSNPFGNLQAAQTAPLRIDSAYVTPVPSQRNGWLVAFTLYLFMASFAIGPGVCVWLALSELMPTRIRSNGMSIALFLNTGTSTAIAAVFLPMVGKYGYATMFFAFAAFTVIYLITALFFLPETKGKTLEEIEVLFEIRNPQDQSAKISST